MRIYERSMEIGHLFSIGVVSDPSETDEWSTTEECSTLAELVIYMIDATGVKTTDALSIATDLINGDKVKIKDHSWDEYCRGFIAGQIIGQPTEKNVKIAEQADELWNNDDGSKYGYYQEAVEDAVLINSESLPEGLEDIPVQDDQEDEDEYPDGFKEYLEDVKARGMKLECPFGCSCYGYLCDGDPYSTPCGRAIEVKEGENDGR